MEKPDLHNLQKETIEKEKIVLAIHSGLLAFCVACLLVLLALPGDSFVVILSSCFFTVAVISFSLIVLSKYHVLHQVRDIHIGHVITSENCAKLPGVIGCASLALGFLSLLFYLSIYPFLIGLLSLHLASKHHKKFKTEMSKMLGAREAVNNQKNT